MDVGKEKIMRSFDELASVYDSSKSSRFASQCHSYVLHILNPMQFNNILDIGCGKGSLMEKLLDTRPQIKGYGLDLSEKIITGFKEYFVDGNNYTEEEIRKFLKQAGFDVVILI